MKFEMLYPKLMPTVKQLRGLARGSPHFARPRLAARFACRGLADTVPANRRWRRTEATIELSSWLLLALVSIATSIVSGVMGLAGGMLLLAVLLLFLDPVTAIPVPGV